jgi:Ser/Thr protein kinase RdoA (MazF antagonist)
MNDETLLEKVTDDFEIGKLISAHRLGGWANRNYKVVTDKGEFVIKILQEHSTDDVNTEAELTNYAAANHINVVNFLKVPHSKSYYTDYDSTLTVCMPFISGRPPRQTHEDIYEIGKALGLLHNLQIPNAIPVRNAWMRTSYLQETIPQITRKIKDEVRFSDAHNALDFDWQGVRHSFIHGDLGPENCLFSDNRLTMFDCEEVMIGPSLADLAMSVLYFCYRNNRHDAFEPECFKQLLAGYESIRQLDDYEKKQLPAAVRFSGLTISVWNRLVDDEWGSLYWLRDLDHFENKLR